MYESSLRFYPRQREVGWKKKVVGGAGGGGGRGADHQVAEVFFISAPWTVMLNSKKVEDLGLVKGACKGIERAGFTVIASEYPSDMGVPFSYYLSYLG